MIKADQARFGGAIRAAADGDGWMVDLLTTERPWSTRLTEIDAALHYLARRVRELGPESFPVLERLLGESLDLVSHRLDAWITSLAAQRLVRHAPTEAQRACSSARTAGWRISTRAARRAGATARSWLRLSPGDDGRDPQERRALAPRRRRGLCR